MSQQQIVLLLELARGATEGADGGVVDVGEGVAGGAVAVGVTLVVETVWLGWLIGEGLKGGQRGGFGER